MPRTFVLTLSCPQRPGIVHAVTLSFSSTAATSSSTSSSMTDPGPLFLRTAVRGGDGDADAAIFRRLRPEVAEEFGMSYQLARRQPQRVLVMVSRWVTASTT